uniref:Uncharacterized protein n=1 Tax=Panagrolaimus sp. JU765 TaxID=591449 RepID=A0AC34Q4M3_9BILA
MATTAGDDLANRKLNDEYVGLKKILMNKKTYFVERIRNYFKNQKYAKEMDEFLSQKTDLFVAHTEWRQDGDDTEGDADSEFEIDLKTFETFDPKQQNAKFRPIDFEQPKNIDDGRLLAFEGAGVEPNFIKIVPEQIWNTFISKTRPNS